MEVFTDHGRAGLGPAITFLFVGPAINILALAYTGVVIGMDIAVARVILSIVFGIGIGLLMALTFRQDDEAHDRALDPSFGGTARLKKKVRAGSLIEQRIMSQAR